VAPVDRESAERIKRIKGKAEIVAFFAFKTTTLFY